MLTPEQTNSIRPRLVTTQVLAGAMIVGAIFFAINISMFIDFEKLGNPLKMLTVISAMTGLAMFGLSIFAPPFFASGESGEEAIAPQASSIMVETMIRYGLIDGAIFLNLIVLFIEPHTANFIMVAIGLLLMLVFFPTKSKFVSTIADRIR